MEYRERAFLNPISSGRPSFIFACSRVEQRRQKEYGDYVLAIADCKRIIELGFSLTGPRKRKQSLAKIDLFAEVVNGLRDAIHAEAKLMDQRRRK